MIILDTNVISALMRSAPEHEVVAWLDEQPMESIWTTSVCVFEIKYGLNAMPAGKKQKVLIAAFDQVLTKDLENRVLDFDLAAATQAAVIAAKLKSAGHSTEIRDVEIAGVVAARRGILATRNVKHFTHTGISLINPWGGIISK